MTSYMNYTAYVYKCINYRIGGVPTRIELNFSSMNKITVRCYQDSYKNFALKLQ